MTLGFLLDTNVISEPLRPSPDPGILGKLKQHQSESAIAAVVWHELLFGCYRLPPSRKRTAIQEYLDQVVKATIPILPYDEQAARWHAAERARLSALGQMPSFADGQIAAIAVVRELAVVTPNTQRFQLFSDITVVNWRAGTAAW